MTDKPEWFAGLPITARYAVHNLARNTRRTLLSVLGVAIGSSVALIDIGMAGGKVDMYLKAMAEGGLGHLRVVPAQWPVKRDASLRLAQWREVLARVRADKEVAVAVPRVRLQGLLAMGTRMAGVEIVGVDPSVEPGAFRYVRVMQSGRYLLPVDRAGMVIGRTLAERLGAGVGDSLVVTVAGSTGAIKNAMFEVLGIVDLGGKLDGTICQIPLAEAATLSGLDGAAEIAVVLKTSDNIGGYTNRLKKALPPGDTAMTWEELSPQGAAAIRFNQAFQVIITVFLVVVALLGVAGAQLTAVLERRREFAVLAALGMGRGAMWKLMLFEGLALGTASLAATMVISVPTVWYFAFVGLRVMPQGGMSMAGVALVDPVFRGNFGPWILTLGALLCYTSTLLASLYPGWFATRLHPAEALRVAA
jgi:ABC-type lipoprotein release transport system permease subunit